MSYDLTKLIKVEGLQQLANRIKNLFYDKDEIDTKFDNVNEGFNNINEELDNINEELNSVVPIEKGGTGNDQGYIRTGAISDSIIGVNATIEGSENIASGNNSHAEGLGTIASGDYSHAEGSFRIVQIPTTLVSGLGNSTEITITNGGMPPSISIDSIISISQEGYPYSEIESINYPTITLKKPISEINFSNKKLYLVFFTQASGNYSHAEGIGNTASGNGSHAQGYQTTASGDYSHAEGNSAKATNYTSHAEGAATTASGRHSHAEGYSTIASGEGSHAEGYMTIAQRKVQHVSGKYNIADDGGTDESTIGNYVEIVGNGTSSSRRSNARTLDWDGNEILAGKLTIGAHPTENMDVTTLSYVQQELNKLKPIIITFDDNTASKTAAEIFNEVPDHQILCSYNNVYYPLTYCSAILAEFGYYNSSADYAKISIDINGNVTFSGA